MLSDSESDSNDFQLTINEHYAKAYAYKKEREELERLKEKYGSDPEESDAERANGGESDEGEFDDSESEDEDGEELTPAVDAAILRTLARIKRKDPDIYDKDRSIFEQERERRGRIRHSKPVARDNTKPLTIKQHALSSILNTSSHSLSPEPQIITHHQEQNALRSETISAFHNALGDDADEDGLLVLREKTKDEVEQEEEEYQAFLEREVGEDIRNLVTVEDHQDIVKEELRRGIDAGNGEGSTSKGMKEKRKKEKEKERQETDQEFLMNYILNRGWIDRSSKRVPTYKEVTDKIYQGLPEDLSAQDKGEGDPAKQLEDEDFDEIADRFESSYNFRFQEPNAATIQTHPRNIESVVRRQNTARKDARVRQKQRKEQELLKKKEEVKRLKALKLKELRRKIEKIGREGGVDIDTQAFAEFDLDGDWDPEKHDSQMAGLYDEEGPEDAEIPQWDNDIDIDDIVKSPTTRPSASKAKKKKKKNDYDTSGDWVNVDAMDADTPMEGDEEEWDGTEEMRKRKVQEYMDQMYGMDFNDMVGDLPTRFKYTTVAAHSYTLTPAEILLATDSELNDYMGVKKFAPYRKDGRWDTRRTERLKELRAKLKQRSWGLGNTHVDGEENGKKKRRGRKERQRAKAEGVMKCEKDERQEGESSRRK